MNRQVGEVRFSIVIQGRVAAPPRPRSSRRRVVERTRRAGLVVLGVVLAATAFGLIAAAHPAAADSREDLAETGLTIGRARDAARTGDLVAARREYSTYENRWFDIEDGVQAGSPEAYRAIERAMSGVRRALAGPSSTPDAVGVALDSLAAEQQRFIASPPQPGAASPSKEAAPGRLTSRPALLALLVVPLGIGAAAAVRRRRHRRPGR